MVMNKEELRKYRQELARKMQEKKKEKKQQEQKLPEQEPKEQKPPEQEPKEEILEEEEDKLPPKEQKPPEQKPPEQEPKEQEQQEQGETLKDKITKKIKIKLGRFGQTVADSEQFVYYKYDLNNVMVDAEVEAERRETKEDMDMLIENRLKLVSEFGDVINVVIDIFSHIATRAFRIYGNKKNNAQNNMNGNGRNSGLAQELGISDEDLDTLMKGGVIK